MAQLADIQIAQKSLEDCFSRRMAQLEAQIQTGNPAKETVAKVADEFRTFRELMFSMLGLLRKQIDDCSRMVDVIETRHRRKDLIFLGISESENENCTSTILDVINKKLALNDCSSSAVRHCHRLGAPSKEHHRPILVRFSNLDMKAAVWKAKSGLKGSNISMKEFLTKSRQTVFVKARHHFGMRSCWTQDGVIVIKAPAGTRHKVTAMCDLMELMERHPKASGDNSSGPSSGSGIGGVKTASRRN